MPRAARCCTTSTSTCRASTPSSRQQGSTAPPFTRNDIYALNALKDQFVGEGGGDEAVRSEFLSALQRKFGAKRGRAVWNDLREANDPEAPASVPRQRALPGAAARTTTATSTSTRAA